MNPIRAMLFDLDGTLLDSAPDLIAALNWLRAAEGLQSLETKEMSRHISHGAVGILTAGMPATDENQFSDWKARFLSRYASVGFRESRLYDGISELLEALENLGIPWGVVTNKMESLTIPIMESAGLMDRAGCVVCGDTLSRSKPDPEPVLFACEQLNVDPENTLFAGDDVRDIQAGVRAGTMTAAVSYGYGSHEFTASNTQSSVLISEPRQFLDILPRMAAN
jgi:phosphoglycolate phosphatase